MEGNFKVLENGLFVLVDWLSFTLFDFSTVGDVIRFLGFDMEEFVKCAHGGKGYKQMLSCSACSISVLYDGNDGMGIHVDISGSGISAVIDHFKKTLKVSTPFGPAYEKDFESTFLRELLKSIRDLGGNITRFDLAIDDKGCNFFTIADVIDLRKKGRVVTKTRKVRLIDDYDGLKDDGTTVYFGKRRSDIMLRIYDKQIEQKNKLRKSLDSNSANTIPPWVRWELELKRDYANRAADSLIAGMELGEVVVGILSHYVRFIELDDSNRSRCSIMEKWQSFIDGVKSLSLYVAPCKKTIADKEAWVNSDVAPTLAAIVIAHGGDMAVLYDMVNSGYSRMKKPLYDLAISTYQQSVKEGGLCDAI